MVSPIETITRRLSNTLRMTVRERYCTRPVVICFRCTLILELTKVYRAKAEALSRSI